MLPKTLTTAAWSPKHLFTGAQNLDFHTMGHQGPEDNLWSRFSILSFGWNSLNSIPWYLFLVLTCLALWIRCNDGRHDTRLARSTCHTHSLCWISQHSSNGLHAREIQSNNADFLHKHSGSWGLSRTHHCPRTVQKLGCREEAEAPAAAE